MRLSRNCHLIPYLLSTQRLPHTLLNALPFQETGVKITFNFSLWQQQSYRNFKD